MTAVLLILFEILKNQTKKKQQPKAIVVHKFHRQPTDVGQWSGDAIDTREKNGTNIETRHVIITSSSPVHSVCQSDSDPD